MIKFRDYLIIQYKRIFKLLPGIVAMILVIAALLGAAGIALMYSDAYQEEQQRYKLGVVGETDDEMISLGVYMIGTLDESRYMIELVEYDDEEAARDAMRSADVSAYIVITDEFSDALNAMTNDKKLKYYATSGQKGISNVMMDEIASIATNIIVYSETGICTVRQLMKEQGYAKAYRSEKIDELFMLYIASLMVRTNVAEITELGLSDGLSTPAYYFSGILAFFMMLLSFCAISFFLGQKNAQYKFMSAKGITAPYQVAGEYIPFLSINVLCTAITLGVIFTVMGLGIFSMEEFSKGYVSDYIGFGIKLIPVCIMFSALGFMIFEILIGVINKILVAFMFYIGMGYVSGYFYPKTFFPGLVQRIGEIIPSGVAFRYISQILTRGHVGFSCLWMFGYTVVFLVVATGLRQQKIR
ncbi:ABC transporter permease [Pseudobutyrivibrio sp.]|uniref:ABC transporter permease n=1 Tax=Pseudobutyrivibrio sp. TaxID=2014367 RepID=UPI0025EF48BE|nr:ABC transporter permease [Pseudobutyrivibrio sp.]MBR5650263.1 ABC transporter permease [Pseudobutyrivibrio sp.]